MNWIALEGAAEHLGDGLDRQGLGEAGDALDQQVPAREQADEDALEHLVLARDDALDLEEGALDRVSVGGAVDGFQVWVICHSRLLCTVGTGRPASRRGLRGL